MAHEIEFEVQLSIGYPTAIRKETLSIWVEGDEDENQIDDMKSEVAIEWMNQIIELTWD